MGRQFQMTELSPPLGRRVTALHFHSLDTLPAVQQMLKIILRIAPSRSAHFQLLLDSLSAPGADFFAELPLYLQRREGCFENVLV